MQKKTLFGWDDDDAPGAHEIQQILSSYSSNSSNFIHNKVVENYLLFLVENHLFIHSN